MIRKDKIKGVLLAGLGLAWIIFVYRFDTLMHRPTGFGFKAVFGCILGTIAAVNGVRIYRRDER